MSIHNAKMCTVARVVFRYVMAHVLFNHYSHLLVICDHYDAVADGVLIVAANSCDRQSPANQLTQVIHVTTVGYLVNIWCLDCHAALLSSLIARKTSICVTFFF